MVILNRLEFNFKDFEFSARLRLVNFGALDEIVS